MNELQEIDNKIACLIEKRQSLVGSGGKYLVFNRAKHKFDDNTYVLDPSLSRDREYLKSYFESMEKSSFRDDMLEWLKDYSTYRCIQGRYCSIVDSSVCCAHCYYKDNCPDVSKMCPFVYNRDVVVITDCEVES